jgi:MerR family transcriptional regulator, redox-sensitive transcriptional activator SoxR
VTDDPSRLTIGELAARSGVAASALRYYETLGLIRAERTGGGQRRYARSTLRRIAFVRAAQRVGLSLEEARDAMAKLPADRAPDATEWSHVARAWQRRIDAEIEALQTLRANLTGCIGCGCLSLRTCKIYNPDDAAAQRGAGARYLLGDSSADFRAPK